MATGQNPTYTCVICGQEGLDELEMKSHVQSAHAGSENTCPFCEFSCVAADEMSAHVNSSHRDELSPVKATNVVTPNAQTASASQCNKALSKDSNSSDSAKRSNLDQTMNREDSKDATFQCPMCTEFVCDSPDVLNLHVNHFHFKDDQPHEPNFASAASKSRPSAKSNASLKNFNNEEQPHHSVFSKKLLDITNFSVGHKEDTPSTKEDSVSETRESESCEVRRESLNDSVLGCSVCDLTIPAGSSLEEHINDKHPQYQEPSNSTDDEGPLLLCPVCAEPAEDSASLQRHVDTHFQEEESLALIADEGQKAQEWERRQRYAANFYDNKPPPTHQPNGTKKQKTSTQSKSKGSKDGGKRQMSILDFCDKEGKDAATASNVLVDDGKTTSKGIIEKLELYYRDKIGKNLKNVWLASPADHYSGSFTDRGWGCGYRNLQMILSCLVKEDAYKKVVFKGQADMPSVGRIQRIIEEAWAKGFDPQGREQLNGKLANTGKWIGATEICNAFSYLNVRCQLVDFYRPTGPDDTHPKLFQWARDYFKAGGFRPPLYLQHQGHSRTIVGVEEGQNGVLTLLLFDPGTPRSQMQQFLRNLITPRLMQVVRRLPSGIKAKQYQVVAVRGILTDAEQQNYKLVRSDRVP